jgi:hypothetical protein
MSGSDSPAAAFDVAEGVAILERTPVPVAGTGCVC